MIQQTSNVYPHEASLGPLACIQVAKQNLEVAYETEFSGF